MVTSAGQCAQIACIWEATANKPGNVSRLHDFVDLTYVDLLLSAAAIAPEMEKAAGRRVGETILASIRATRQVVRTNTNLGIVLLIAPLAAVPVGEPLRHGLERFLDRLDVADARFAYEAVRLAEPGGMGRVKEQDVSDEPTRPLREVMALAAERDLVARQYDNGFGEVFDIGLPSLQKALRSAHDLESVIIHAFLSLLAECPDSLIARKCGLGEAEEVTRRARSVLGGGDLAEFDCWLRADGHRRNPGTTADLTAASLFVALREGIIELPPQLPWAAGA
jgi:triphosphoribosyl-dephospho-CoA synthase